MKVDKENDPHVRLYKDYSSSSNPSPSAKNSQCQMPQCDNGKLLSLLYLLLHLEKKMSSVKQHIRPQILSILNEPKHKVTDTDISCSYDRYTIMLMNHAVDFLAFCLGLEEADILYDLYIVMKCK